MPAFASLLRGVNVGRAAAVGMPALAKVYSTLGLEGVQTVIRSGNVVFRTSQRNRAALAGALEDAIEKRFGFRPKVYLRSTEELRDVVARNPFPEAARSDPGRLLVLFYERDLGPAARALAGFAGPERFKVSGSEIYVHYVEGSGRSKFNPFLDRAIEARGTARNWNTVNKLVQICGALEAS
jgi:uncharacterized protein (DUF1697 family)